MISKLFATAIIVVALISASTFSLQDVSAKYKCKYICFDKCKDTFVTHPVKDACRTKLGGGKTDECDKACKEEQEKDKKDD